MTYKDNFVVEIKVNGKILRVKNDIVYLPFGCEYSIFMKNLNSVKACVNVSIDGQDVLDNKRLVINPNSSIDLQGFLKDTQVTNRFKFIQKTKQIQDYRGDRIDDGLVRIEFAFEKQNTPIVIIHENIYNHNNNPFHWNYGNTYGSDKINNNSMRGEIRATFSSCDSSRSMEEFIKLFPNINTQNIPQQDEGITVKGSESKQSFNKTIMGDLEQSQVITFQLKGLTDSGNVIKEELTVKSKLICSTCGTSNKSSYKYCTNCGTFLE